MEFDPETFSHILCTHFTFYELRDKPTFVKNCRRWLKIGGYMVLHLVDKMHFDTIAPIGKIPNMTNANERILSTSVRLSNMLYTNKFLFQENDIVKRIETFTCNKTKHVRHQE